jgi:predicted alpha/beta-hydrolase family hydrolase
MTYVLDASTRAGLGRWHVAEPPGVAALALVALGHGAGGGVEARDLTVVTEALAGRGFQVARFEQPWRVAGRRVAGPPAQLDTAWCDALQQLRSAKVCQQLPLVVGGRSAGARVACRTARDVGAVGVVALAFPLHPPGRPDRSRGAELPFLPVLVVQGGRDPFGTPDDVLRAGAGRSSLTVLAVPGADHALRVSRAAPITQREADELVAVGVRRWARQQVAGNHR